MNKYLSDKLKILSFILMVLVIVLHSYKAVIKFDAGNLDFTAGYSFFIQLFFSEGMARIAVPLFFGISGYLFFLKLNGRIPEFMLKYRARIRSLVVPYLLWSVWSLLLYFILQSFPLSNHFFTRELIMHYSFTEILNTIILDPVPYQLWFLRDLIILVAIAPLIYWSIRYSKAALILLLLVIWPEFFDFNFVIFRNESILFFSLGAYLAIHKSNFLFTKLTQTRYLVFAFLWLVTVLLKTILIYQRSDEMVLIVLLGKLSILTGIVAVWSLYDMSMKNKTAPGKLLLSLSSFSFFIYGFHEPILTILQKGLFYVTGATAIMTTVNYVLAPAITLMIGITLGYLLKRYMPLFYGLITGGR